MFTNRDGPTTSVAYMSAARGSNGPAVKVNCKCGETGVAFYPCLGRLIFGKTLSFDVSGDEELEREVIYENRLRGL